MNKKKTIKVKFVDPPSGWRYGFPAILPDDMTYEELLKKKGYPESHMKLALEHSRYWFQDKEVDDD